MNPDNIREVLKYTNDTPIYFMSYDSNLVTKLFKNVCYENNEAFLNMLLEKKLITNEQINQNYWFQNRNIMWPYDVTERDTVSFTQCT